MKTKNYFSYILIIITIIFFNFSGKVYSQSSDELYKKIDLFKRARLQQNAQVVDIDQERRQRKLKK